MELKAKKPAAPPMPVLACRMSPALAAEICGKFRADIPIPREGVKIGDRLFLREWAGAPSGRADIGRVVAVAATRCTIERSWCWHRGKDNDDLSALGLAVIPELFPAIGYAADEAPPAPASAPAPIEFCDAVELPDP